jgi:hypothetical protein
MVDEDSEEVDGFWRRKENICSRNFRERTDRKKNNDRGCANGTRDARYFYSTSSANGQVRLCGADRHVRATLVYTQKNRKFQMENVVRDLAKLLGLVQKFGYIRDRNRRLQEEMPHDIRTSPT